MKTVPLALLMVLAALLAAPARADGPGPRPSEGFADPGSAPHYDRVRAYDLVHTVLDLRLDWDARAVEGTVTHRLVPIRTDLAEVPFDQHGITFRSMQVNGEDATWREEADTVIVVPPRPLPRGREAEIVIAYRAENPSEGMYWNIPDRDYPDRPYQVWTQGEQDENRFWFPTYDYPNDRATSEEIVTVDARYTVIGNGELVEKRDNGDGTVTWRYRMDIPHVTYLQSLIVGEYTVYETEWDGIPILSYVQPELFDLAEPAFSPTALMMKIMSEKTGIRYPYPAYRQTTVENFLWGGMENISATTLTNRTLRTPEAFTVSTSEGLVAHELAHQWWGDLVTTKNWANVWLNEGFATYLEKLYWEFGVGPEAARWDLYGDLRAYLREDRGQYRRPLVTRYYRDSGDVFDDVAYQKGALVLNMLRHLLGDDLMWETFRTYGERLRGKVAETADFRRAAEDVGGIPLDRFFDQWVHRGGHPEFKVSWKDEASPNHEDGSRLVHLHVEQTQEVNDLTPLFHCDVAVDLTGEDWTRRYTITCDAADQHFYFEVPSPPLLHEFDRDDVLIKTLEEDKKAGELEYQIQHSPALISRCRAAEALGGKGDAGSVPVLRSVLLDEEAFHGLRGEAALALGRLDIPESRDVLLGAVAVKEPRVRLKVAEALGSFDEPAVLRALDRVAGDPVTPVAEAALTAVAKTKSDEAPAILKKGLKRLGWLEGIRRAAIRGFRTLKDPEWIGLITPFTEPGVYIETRQDAISALGVLGAELEEDNARRKVMRRLETLLDDPLIRVRQGAINALGALGEEDAVPALERVVNRKEHRWVQKAAKRAVVTLRTGKSKDAALREMERDMDELRRENETIKKDVRQMRMRLDPERPDTPESSGSPPGPR
jgi:aminopeptidase N